MRHYIKPSWHFPSVLTISRLDLNAVQIQVTVDGPERTYCVETLRMGKRKTTWQQHILGTRGGLYWIRKLRPQHYYLARLRTLEAADPASSIIVFKTL